VSIQNGAKSLPNGDGYFHFINHDAKGNANAQVYIHLLAEPDGTSAQAGCWGLLLAIAPASVEGAGNTPLPAL
jgi:hypothetical protein